MNIPKYLELLAPAGNLEKLNTAYAFGADAVYLGLPDFSLRQRVNGFDLEALKTAVGIAKAQGKKIYVTVNIFAHNRHLAELPPYLKQLSDLAVDALIISDPGILAMAKQYCPGIKLHLSTQANCTNWQAADFWYRQGVSRVVLGRETALEEIAEIHQHCPELELEYFAHGAMCMAYSGRCFLSKHFNDRSANLGDCSQPCRWQYSVNEIRLNDRQLDIEEDTNGSYFFNSKDLCLLEQLPALIAAGVTSFKIEGRAKSVYYLAVVTNIYRRALNDLLRTTTQEDWSAMREELETRLNHRGYTTGFLLGLKGEQNTAGQAESADWEFCGQVLSCQPLANGYQLKIKVHNTLKLHEDLELVRPGLAPISFKPQQLLDVEQQAISEIHGGGGSGEVIAYLDCPVDCPPLAVLRRQKV